MTASVLRYGLCCLILTLGLQVTLATAAQPSESLLPTTTKGFISIPDIGVLVESWNETQLGQLMADEKMQPFVEDLKRQMRSNMNRADKQLGLTWSDLKSVYGGDVCLAVAQPWDSQKEAQAIEAYVAKAVAAAKAKNKSDAEIAEITREASKEAEAEQSEKRVAQRALIVLVDVTNHDDETQLLLKKIDQEFTKRKATKTAKTIRGVETTVYTVAATEELPANQAFIAVHQDRLIAVDHEEVIDQVISRFGAAEGASLVSVPAFKHAFDRSDEAFGETTPHVRWFVDPFGFTEIMRAYDQGRRRRGTDMLRVLANQGFDAVKGVGGYVVLSQEQYEIMHRTFVYAPAVERTPDDKRTEKYNLAARMLDFPNAGMLAPPKWVPRDLASYLSFNWDVQKAFYSAETLVNEIAGDEVFQDVLESIKTDQNGPQIDIEKELVAFLGTRATLISDYREPITPKSERMLFAIEVRNPAAVMDTVNRAMESDPAAKKRVFGELIIWEILNDDPYETKTLKIDGFGFDSFSEDEPEEEEEEPMIPNSAVTVAYGHLIIASHVDYVVDILTERKADDQLSAAVDHQLVHQALVELGSGNDSFNFFVRTDESIRVTYEMMKQGRMPESESVLGKLLNRIFEPEEEDTLREQQIDGGELPDFEVARRYLGPGGFYVRSTELGWDIAGCLLSK
ncbi:MAG TPA: hypothetical protein QF564_05020 [Pirellulaceae bacterium]|nr:hypothetical protein [Pirellulaceae bacterium]